MAQRMSLYIEHSIIVINLFSYRHPGMIVRGRRRRSLKKIGILRHSDPVPGRQVSYQLDIYRGDLVTGPGGSREDLVAGR